MQLTVGRIKITATKTKYLAPLLIGELIQMHEIRGRNLGFQIGQNQVAGLTLINARYIWCDGYDDFHFVQELGG